MNPEYREKIANEFRNCVTSTINRIQNQADTFKPFHSALLSENAVFWSRFERSFSTSFGQRVVEEIARLLALSNGSCEAQRQRETMVTLDRALIHAIDAHIQAIRDNQNQLTSWQDVIDFFNTVPLSGVTETVRVISDVWWVKNGTEHFVSLKTVKPNIDQTAVAKRDCLLLYLNDPNRQVFFGLPYNPYGDNGRYNFNPPMKMFNFNEDPVVLIGRELWDTIGGDGSYNELIEIATEVGNETIPEIDRLR
ncbi:TPA: TdeIII family type II restriction endonuclease [Streptococcus suis]|nr:TdeIII family type II restriction endonuclease [Streptococcus phage YS162]HEM6011587.1 TdeIII family type II restriction endonuclease [Streptococcus suis]HEM6013422.1 TdeIII family type II restriction endonuclease [Streptococcus suis]HEM6040023.1 TdeIII family type II restriction endonuclease [Streptococcus suis]HEM6041962.1 TdeIII family type II restriction endonuclease [Streptococcus suis]